MIPEETRASIIARFTGPLPRWLFFVLVPGVAGPILILGFIFATEIAHDPSRCPYVRASQQPLAAGVSVREDGRSCVPGIEERRYTLVRGDHEQVLGRRRFRRAAFEPGQYAWSAALSADGEARVTVDNKGHDRAVFREGKPNEK